MTTEVAAPVTGGEPSAAPAAVDVDAASLAAVREAMGTVDTPAPAADTEAAAPGVAAPEAAPATPAQASELEQLRLVLKQREDEQRSRERAKAELRAEVAKELEAETNAARAKAFEEAKAEAREAYKRQFRERPVDAIRDLELDGAQLVTDLANRAGPAGAAMNEIAQLRAEIDALKTRGSADLKAEVEALKAARAKDEQQYLEATRQAEDRQLLTVVTEKTPTLTSFYGDEGAVVKRAREIASEYCAAKQVERCPYGVIVQELESEARRGVTDELKKLDARREALSKLVQQPAPVAGKPTEMNGQHGPRTLSAQGASERRASPKSPAEMTAAEQDEAMRAAVRDTMGPPKRTRMAT